MTDDANCQFERTHETRLKTASPTDSVLNGRASQCAAHREFSTDWLSAASSDAAQSQSFYLARLWIETRAGTWRFKDAFSSAERYFAVLEQTSLRTESRVRARNLEFLERVLLGQAPKVVAIELGVGISTVATGVQETLRSMGLQCRISNSPVMLTMAVRAACRAQEAPTLGRLTRVKADQDKYWLVSVRRPDLEFPVELSQAEAAVVRQLVAGRTHVEISQQRTTSTRTVANQLAAAFRKLGVSGRGAIVHQLIAHNLRAQSDGVAPAAPLPAE
jgi:DNA-binding NarL/FixJ family response regulator